MVQVYTSSVTNLDQYSLDTRFVPEHSKLPHEGGRSLKMD